MLLLTTLLKSIKLQIRRKKFNFKHTLLYFWCSSVKKTYIDNQQIKFILKINLKPFCFQSIFDRAQTSSWQTLTMLFTLINILHEYSVNQRDGVVVCTNWVHSLITKSETVAVQFVVIVSVIIYHIFTNYTYIFKIHSPWVTFLDHPCNLEYLSSWLTFVAGHLLFDVDLYKQRHLIENSVSTNMDVT